MSYPEGGHFPGAETMEVTEHTPDTLPVLLMLDGQAAAHSEWGTLPESFRQWWPRGAGVYVQPHPASLPWEGRAVYLSKR